MQMLIGHGQVPTIMPEASNNTELLEMQLLFILFPAKFDFRSQYKHIYQKNLKKHRKPTLPVLCSFFLNR